MAEWVELVGAGKIRNDLRMLSERLLAPEQALETEMEILEEVESSVFDGFGGKYVDSGRLKASLTERNARDAIRRVLGNTLEFGTRTWYARFQTKIGGPSGKPRGRKRPLPILVLKLTPALRQAASRAIAARLFGRP